MPSLNDYDISSTFKATVVKTVRITPDDYPDEVRHLDLEIAERPALRFELGQSVGVLVPGPHEFGNKQHLRLYSIAGIPDDKPGEKRTLSISVKRCFYIDDYSGERYPGVASNFLCDRRPGDTVTLSGPYASAFKFPDDPAANLLMVGVSTGIAPFRAFIKHIYDHVGGWKGKVRLFYGAKRGLELLYMNDQNNDLVHYYDRDTFRAFEAVSPRPHMEEPAALDRTLEENTKEVWDLIEDPKTYVYVAGLEKARDLFDKALSKMAGSEENWQRKKRAIEADGRWAELLY